MSRVRRIAFVSPECVACGCCMKSCPLTAIAIPKGVVAIVDENKCVGCGRCAAGCPAQVISITTREVAYATQEKVV